MDLYLQQIQYHHADDTKYFIELLSLRLDGIEREIFDYQFEQWIFLFLLMTELSQLIFSGNIVVDLVL